MGVTVVLTVVPFHDEIWVSPFLAPFFGGDFSTLDLWIDIPEFVYANARMGDAVSCTIISEDQSLATLNLEV